jgi:GAF domain-containing protein
LIQQAALRTAETEEAFGLSRHVVRLETAGADDQAASGRDVPCEAALAAPSVVAAVDRDAVGRPANAREVLLAGLAEATESLARETDLNSVIRIVVEAIYVGLGYARAAFLLRDPAANLYRTRASFGEPPLKLSFPAQYAPDLFHAALSHATDLHIADAASPKVVAKLPVWFARELPQSTSFLLMPLTVGERPLGLFFADRPVPDAKGLSSEELNLLRALRSQVVLAIRSR